MSASIIAFANQKGGVGKTTSAVNIAACVGAMGKKVLLIDADAQGNASTGVGVNKRSITLTTYDVIIGRTAANSAIMKTSFKNLWVMPANTALAAADFELVYTDNREFRLKDALALIKDDYDYIFIDCPPSLGMMTVNGITAADGVIIPLQCEFLALEGLTQLIHTIRQIKRLYNPTVEITGILVTMYNGRLNLSVQIMDELKKYYPDKLFSSPIIRNVRLSEAPGYGEPIIYYDKYSKGSDLYNSVAKEVIDRT